MTMKGGGKSRKTDQAPMEPRFVGTFSFLPGILKSQHPYGLVYAADLLHSPMKEEVCLH